MYASAPVAHKVRVYEMKRAEVDDERRGGAKAKPVEVPGFAVYADGAAAAKAAAKAKAGDLGLAIRSLNHLAAGGLVLYVWV